MSPALRYTLVFALLPLLAAQRSGDSVRAALPTDARIIETADVTAIAGKPRTLVLWMVHPVRQNTGSPFCGTAVLGQLALVGPTRLSLVDPSGPALINTIRIFGRNNKGEITDDSFYIPLLVSNDYWHVPHLHAGDWGIPQILGLRDFTGDGKPAQFVMLLYDACGIVSTSVLGYASSSDRAVQYPIEVTDPEGKHRATWVEQIFARAPVSPGHWKFSWQPAHGTDYVLHEDVRFDPARQVFIERQTRSDPGK